MLALLDTGQDLDACESEIGVRVGQLLTPLTRYRLQDPHRPWAIDNGAYARFEPRSFRSLLEREKARREECLFVSAPDVVGSARRTLEVFSHWRHELSGWRRAFVCQDGQENLPIPWSHIDAVFIGGSTTWKSSQHVVQIIKAAQALEKWVHIGRVNDPERWLYFEELGADSCDGTGLARYTHMRSSINGRHRQHPLFSGDSAGQTP